ncbi:hypothetical protein [Actinoallomurus sp. CA-150999]|uniref:hypothetical protein n=1 Tax=Actinoallomurus sp. CA-150999 TaxID=3239887 RepID=UPI003D8CC797
MEYVTPAVRRTPGLVFSAAVVLLAFERTAPVGLVPTGAVLLAFAGGVHRALRTGRSAT